MKGWYRKNTASAHYFAGGNISICGMLKWVTVEHYVSHERFPENEVTCAVCRKLISKRAKADFQDFLDQWAEERANPKCSICKKPVAANTRICSACVAKENDKKKQDHFDKLDAMTLEERIRRIEEILYKKPWVHTHIEHVRFK